MDFEWPDDLLALRDEAAKVGAEAAADLAALELTGDPQTYVAMHVALARANLTEPLPPRWAYLLWSTHPPVAARLEMGRRWPELSNPRRPVAQS